jgi:hypothetical protein
LLRHSASRELNSGLICPAASKEVLATLLKISDNFSQPVNSRDCKHLRQLGQTSCEAVFERRNVQSC